MVFAEIVLAGVALLGHFVLWIAINNRFHAIRLKRSRLKPLSGLMHLGTLALPVGLACWIYWNEVRLDSWLVTFEQHWLVAFYFLVCLGVAIVHLPRWLYVRFGPLRAAWQHGRRLKLVNMVERLGRHPSRGWKFAVGRRLPFNEVMHVEITEKEVPLANLPATWEGLRIAHISDLHFSGRVEPAFFHEVVRELNELRPDLVVITGDICDVPQCLDWIGEILRPVQAKHGKFFILGNHDDRLKDIQKLRATISAAGFTDVGGRWHTLSIDGAELLLAGNERPWFNPAPSAEEIPDQPRATAPLRILLSHSPDQVRWAKQHNIDLMLTGHTHGGQICFPLIGPVVCPSCYGVRYASGLFLEPDLALHVSRGVSGLFPIRFNCRPEATILVLKRASVV